ncbi:MAG: CDP-alcohol phosphatidyltransferase family protein [Prevotella sp.]|uniref:CDP-alcohol phosphatidyltransferase family protein n=1 Tax=Prevotella sp. TaxID=59823 RepID=UPI002A2CDF8B|nr:CDP-alcohol phosphatidyltransferase family protein [Prevotella sp.]MDD7317372.1 CDP-alcohol phosphatidyltransferase family protein [Prevotellaceae bacterium]MDY4019470.1 CDP-alcohol phosphatidyltransferase family protein [Prevotella sp.]
MVRNIPNSITCCNLISGCIATMYAFGCDQKMALLFIVIGATFDFFDGMSARLLGVSSPIGKELDSLADVITFGMAPATMVFTLLSGLNYPATLAPLRPILPYTAFLIAAFSALRLAKFNLDERQAMGFIGLPTPANALFWSSAIVGIGAILAHHEWAPIAVLPMILLSCFLLIAELPMFALKFKHTGWRGNEVKFIFILTCVPLLVFLGLPGFAAVIAWYVVLSMIVWIGKNNKERK